MSTKLEIVQGMVSDCMDQMLTNFKPGAKITVLIRVPGKDEADFLMTSDDLDDVIDAVQRRKAAAKAGDAPAGPQEVPGELEFFDGKLTPVIDANRYGWRRFHEHYDWVERPRTALPYQKRVRHWIDACFGNDPVDVAERNFRFLEEALELAQSSGATADEARTLIDYVFGRPVGDVRQEVGGVEVTLAALCSAQGIDLDEAREAELTRVWSKVEQIRAKHESKPKGVRSPLPGGADV